MWMPEFVKTTIPQWSFNVSHGSPRGYPGRSPHTGAPGRSQGSPGSETLIFEYMVLSIGGSELPHRSTEDKLIISSYRSADPNSRIDLLRISWIYRPIHRRIWTRILRWRIDVSDLLLYYLIVCLYVGIRLVPFYLKGLVVCVVKKWWRRLCWRISVHWL